MIKVTHEKLNETIEIKRIIGRYTQNKPGPTAIFLCGSHGNETSSVFAMKKVFEKLNEENPDIEGEMVAAFAGNMKALKEGVRYIDMDLNRGWIPHRLRKLGFLSEKDQVKGHEKKEQGELIKLLRDAIGRAKGEIFVFDLHTTSSESPPFCAISDTIRNRKVAIKFPVPCVVGFDEKTKGTFMNYINEMGITGVAFEAGEHFALASIENNVSFIWLALSVIGCIKKEHITDYKKHYANLSKSNFGEHKIFDLIYHHEISEEDNFKMRPGYTTFDKIEKGEHIANDKNGPVLAQKSGHIFMPLYQKQGDDGYFIVKEKGEKWLKLSEELRKARDDKKLLNLDGVKRYKDDLHTLEIEPSLLDDILDRLHLMGFRRLRHENGKVIITRRVYDVEAPELEELDVY